MKIISDLPLNQKVFLLQDENFALNINKRMKAISAEHSWCACEAMRKEFTWGCSYGLPRAGHSSLMEGNWTLAGLRSQPQSQPAHII